MGEAEETEADDLPEEAPERPLTARQQRFVEEYLLDLNGTQAAIRAGYSACGADATGVRLTGIPRVRAVIDQAIAKRRAKSEISADRVLRELAIIAFADLGEVMTVSEDGTVNIKPLDTMDPDARRAIGEITQTVTERFEGGERGEVKATIEKVRTGVKHHSKVKALELLMGHLGMNQPTKVEVSGEVAVTTAKQALGAKLDELKQRVAAEPSGTAGSEPTVTG